MLVYSLANDEVRTPIARSWLARGGTISVQVLNEFANTARRKLHRPWEEVTEALGALRAICSECISVTEQLHHHAIDLARGHGFGLFDALIVAAALDAKCTMLVTGDGGSAAWQSHR